MDTPSTSNSHESTATHVKRNRVQLSCTPCRHVKLKCDRAQPCSQCQKKDRVGSCIYLTPQPRKRAAMSMQKRLKHLESLVKDVMNSQPASVPHTPPRDDQEPSRLAAIAAALGISSEAPRSNTADNSSSEFNNSSTVQHTEATSGQVVFGGKGTQYVGATHWAAILNDIGEVKDYFDEGEEEDVEGENELDASLIFNTDAPPTKAGILAALPPRRVVDKLIQGYFHGGNPSLHILHAPTFQNEYVRFWANPHDTPLAWLGLLYGIMCLSLFSSYAAGENNPDERASSMQTMRTYRRNCIQCIRLSDYIKPGKYTIQAMLAHLEGEFVLSDADQVDCYVVLGVAVRLALRLGLHRDPDKVGGEMTPFEGEMRRRLWNILRQIDLLASFQIGLPGMIESIDSDVLLPRNLNDLDFDEDCTELPPSRPDSEVTSMTYIRFKSRVCQVFGKIARYANSLSPPSYNEIMKLDAQLNEIHVTIPPSFQFRPIDNCIADSSQLIIQRLNLAHLICKSRCVLHRKYLVGNQDYPEHEYSVTAGINAAMQLLDFQQQTYEATQPGEVLSRDRCFPSSLSMHDFLLAAMIVYMRTMKILEGESKGTHLTASYQKQKMDMISALKISSDIWHISQIKYHEFKRAADVLAVMMRKIHAASVTLGEQSTAWDMVLSTNYENSIAGLSLEDGFAMDQATTNPLGAVTWSMNPPAPATSSYFPDTTLPQQNSLHETIPFDYLMDLPTNFEWETFDNHIRADAYQLPLHDQHLPNINLDMDGFDRFDFGGGQDNGSGGVADNKDHQSILFQGFATQDRDSKS
ncbi:hypothetical protein SBOR_7563 [Sclerotinia borealis F-4128]|uniref:Zn(2)-C6 fungal-type domain-containing protein n=1 Tax=Sclerotinia borealis (strain F-4128) TaxID=1432307 RepID=W9C8D5_SCLBF|nr:hypothetical protein SBOR_7563 [Sclerotinia borealis F-4128]